MEKYKCWKCGHIFLPRVENPVKCPNPKCQISYKEKSPLIIKPKQKPVGNG